MADRPVRRFVQEVETETRETTASPDPVEWVEGIAAYQPVSSLDRIWANPSQVPLKLDWNESSIPPSPKVYQAIVQFLSHSNHLNWYPELGSRSLADALSDYVRLPADSILVTNGSDDALDLICKTYLGPHDKVLVPMPTYTHFLVYVEARGARIASFHSSDLFDADIDALDRAVTHDTKLVYLVSPNNPSGVTYATEDVARLCANHPNTVFIVDEAYHEFYGRSVAPLVPEYANLVVTRTFSKCFGIAGLRVGYLMAGPGMMAQLKKLYNPKSVNRVGQIAALACLSDLPYYQRYVEEVTAARTLLRTELARRNLELIPTPANYALLKVPDPERFCNLLACEGVYVRDRSSLPRLEGYVRISIPTVAQARDLIDRIDRVLDRFKDLQ
jgi:histidinol-phosphate aminotransferase